MGGRLYEYARHASEWWRARYTSEKIRRIGMVSVAAVVLGGFGWAALAPHWVRASGVAPSIRGTSSATVRYSVSPKTITAPTNASGDLLIIVFVSDSGSITDMTLPTGFSKVAQREFDLNSDHMVIGTKVATSSEPTSYTYVAPSGADTRVDMFSVMNADTTNAPIISTSETPSSYTSHTTPSLSPQGTNDLMISGIALMSNPSNPGGGVTWTAPTGMTKQTDAETWTILTMASASQALTGGVTGAKTFTEAGTTTAVKGLAYSMAINGVGDTPGAMPAPLTPSVRDVKTATVPYTVANPKTIAAPTTVAGDLLVMVFLSDWGTVDSMSLPSGFMPQYRLERGLNKNHMLVGTKVATASEPSSYSYSADASADTRVDLFSIKDADTLAPFVGNGVVPTTTVNYLTAPSITPLGTNDLLLGSANLVSYPQPGATTWTSPFDMTEYTDAETTNLSQTVAMQPLTQGGITGGRTFLAAPTTTEPGDAFQVGIKGLGGNSSLVLPSSNVSNGWKVGDYTSIDDGQGPNTTSDYLGDSSATDLDAATFGLQNTTNVSQASSVTLSVCSYSATNALGGTMDTLENNLIVNGVAQTSYTTTPLYDSAGTGFCKWEQHTFYGNWTQSDISNLQMKFIRHLQGTGSNSAKADDIRIVSAYATVVYSSPPSVSQAAYRWFANADSTTPGSPLAAANTVANAPAAGTPMRLRLNLGAATGDVVATSAYKLRYQLKSGSCSTNPASYSDISTSTPIKFYDNPSVTSGALYAATANDPSRSGILPVIQTYQEANPFSVVTSVWKNEDGLWDFALTMDASAPQGSSYCVMATNTDNTALSGGYTTIAEIAVPAPSLDQSNYRFYQNNDGIAPGAPLAAQNTPATVDTGATYRLRQLVTQTAGSTATSQGFKLQAGQKVTTCSAATYADTPTIMYDNPSVADEAAIGTTANDPTPNSGLVVLQTYSENPVMTLPIGLQASNNALWDFSLKSDSSMNNTTYCFRVVKSDGSLLATYSQYPEVSFTVAASTIDQQLRGGQAYMNGVKHGFSW